MKLNTKDFETRMEKAIGALNNNFDTIRAGQANAAVLNRVSFEYYGAPTPLNSMADIRQADARTLVIKPYDGSTLKAMEKAILASDVGITPANDGQVIRLVFPVMTEERRKELVKQIKKMGEDAKVAVRNSRRDAMDAIKKMKTAKELSEDEAAGCEADVEKAVSATMAKLENVIANKEKELMSI